MVTTRKDVSMRDMELTRRGFLLLSLLTLGGCGDSSSSKKDEDEGEKESKKKSKKGKKSKKKQEEEKEPRQIVDETTYYEVFRCDWKEGVLGDVEVYVKDSYDFGDSYAMLDPDGTFNFEINGVPYNGHIELDGKAKHLYSGVKDYEFDRILFDGKEYGNVGTVDFEGFYEPNEGYILIDMTTSVDGKFTSATFYLWKVRDA